MNPFKQQQHFKKQQENKQSNPPMLHITQTSPKTTNLVTLQVIHSSPHAQILRKTKITIQRQNLSIFQTRLIVRVYVNSLQKQSNLIRLREPKNRLLNQGFSLVILNRSQFHCISTLILRGILPRSHLHSSNRGNYHCPPPPPATHLLKKKISTPRRESTRSRRCSKSAMENPLRDS